MSVLSSLKKKDKKDSADKSKIKDMTDKEYKAMMSEIGIDPKAKKPKESDSDSAAAAAELLKQVASENQIPEAPTFEEKDDATKRDGNYDTMENVVTAEFKDILENVQQYMSTQHSDILVLDNENEVKDHVINLISVYVRGKGYHVENMTFDELVQKLYDYMASIAFLDKYLSDPDMEEVNINSWNDVEIIRCGKFTEKIDDAFTSPKQARDIISRMISAVGRTLDGATPMVVANYTSNIRIAALIPPLIDKEIGVSASIRIVNQKQVSADMFIRNGSATRDMLYFIKMCLLYGVSTCVAGAVGSGKTTMMQYILSQVPNDRRLITMEDGSRELNNHRYREDGRALNSVIHQITRPVLGDEDRNISQDKLLELNLRMHASILAVGEIRAAKECMAVAESARTGTTCVTTIHSNSAADTYRRMMTLAKRENDLDTATLMDIMCEAFPVIIYMRQLANGERRIMEIVEALGTENGKPVTRTLFQYVVEKNERNEETGEVTIVGHHQFVNPISDRMRGIMLANGISVNELNELDRIMPPERKEV